jgi:L-fuconolactonase
MIQPVADTHVHVWDFNKAEYAWLKGNTSLLNRNYAVNEIEAERNSTGITKGILVQAANNSEDTAWMLEVVKQTPWICGVVGWLPLTDPEATARALDETYKDELYFKGVRHLIHDEPDARWLLQPAVIESLQLLAAKNIPYDVVGVLPEHIQTVLELAEKVPDLRMIFDHLNQPPIAAGERFGKWGELMQEAARHPNFLPRFQDLAPRCKKRRPGPLPIFSPMWNLHWSILEQHVVAVAATGLFPYWQVRTPIHGNNTKNYSIQD